MSKICSKCGVLQPKTVQVFKQKGKMLVRCCFICGGDLIKNKKQDERE